MTGLKFSVNDTNFIHNIHEFPSTHPTPLSPKFPYMQREICLSLVVEFSEMGMTASSLE